MVLTHPFRCPTHIVEGHRFDLALSELIAGRPWILATSRGWPARGVIDNIFGACGAAEQLIDDIDENPTIEIVEAMVPHLKGGELLVALGGGSVIDAVKGAAALAALGDDRATFLEHLRDGVALPEDLSPKPIIAIPTTAGTGSEVTQWGTIWGKGEIKHSVKHAALYPSHAILDPELTCTMPRELTIATGLDALSHAMESIWNRHHSVISDMLASQAIALLYENLIKAVDRPDDIAARTLIQTAATMAGLAMGTTQTAIAHSISYPFTAHFRMPHGLACSFTLPEAARYNMEADPDRLLPIADGFGCSVEQLPEFLYQWYAKLGVGELVMHYVQPSVTDELGDKLITRARAANNIREVDGATARRLARNALDRLS